MTKFISLNKSNNQSNKIGNMLAVTIFLVNVLIVVILKPEHPIQNIIIKAIVVLIFCAVFVFFARELNALWRWLLTIIIILLSLVVIVLIVLKPLKEFFLPQRFPTDIFSVLVTTFGQGDKYKASNDGVELRKLLIKAIETKIENRGLRKEISVKYDIRIIANKNSARKRGEQRNADIVIWGWCTHDKKTLFPKLEILNKDLLETKIVKKEGFEEVVSLEGSYEIANLMAKRIDLLVHFIFALSFLSNKKYDYAIENFRELIRDVAKYISEYDMKKEPIKKEVLDLFIGDAYYSANKPDSAIAMYQAILDYTESAQAYLHLGFVYQNYNGKKISEIRNAYEKAADLDAMVIPQVSNNLGVALLYRNRRLAEQCDYKFSESIQMFHQAIAFDSNFASAHVNLGTLYYIKGNFYQAEIELMKGISIDPENAMAYNNLGLTYKKLNDINRAIEYLKAAIKREPNIAVIYNNLGNAYRKLPEIDSAIIDSAIAAYQNAISTDTNYATPHFNLSYCYEAKGNIQKAISELERFLQLSSDTFWNKDAQEDLKRLRNSTKTRLLK